MLRLLKTSFAFLAFLAVVSGASASERRLALVIGNASYKAKALATPVNDAALIAQTLQAAGFDVTGARDIKGDLLRQTFRDFADRVAKAGPDAVAAVYFAGHGLQFEGENYLIPIDANISEISDLPVRAVPLSEQMHLLAALHSKATFIVLDVARAGPPVLPGLASGLAWVEPEANMLIAFNAAPGTVAPDVGEGYSPYAKALAEMIREGNLAPANMFDRVRLRVNELTKGAQVPWDVSNIETQFQFLDRAPGAPPRADSPDHTVSMRSQSMRSLGATDAYMTALMRDTFDAYADFLADYWQDPMTKRVLALLAARREAITWRRTCKANEPDAYWSYLERYPRGPHLADARRLLTRLGAPPEPPPKFARMDYDVPPPLPDELEYVERTVLVFDDPALAFERPQPSPAYFLAPPPSEFLDLKPLPAPSGAHNLPLPTLVLLPAYIRLPADVLVPNSSISDNVGETLAIRTASEIPTKPEERAARPSISAPNPLAINPVSPEETKAPLNPLSPTASLTPQWLGDMTISSNPKNESPAVPTKGEAPISAFTTVAPAFVRPPQTRPDAVPPPTAGFPPPVPRSPALARPQTDLAPQTTRPATPSSQTTGSIPPSVLGPATLAPRQTSNRTKPPANVASTPSQISTPSQLKRDQAKQAKPALENRPIPSQIPQSAPVISPTQ
jgi:uncharacterized caspase-like protein